MAVSSAVRGGGSKKAMARTSIDLRGGASGGEAGSVKAVWKTKRGPSTFLSYTWTQGRVAAWTQVGSYTWTQGRAAAWSQRYHTTGSLPSCRMPSSRLACLLLPTTACFSRTYSGTAHLEHEALVSAHVRVGVPLVGGRVAQRVVLARAASTAVGEWVAGSRRW